MHLLGIRQSRFLYASGFFTLILAHMSDSLVRVSRRVGSVRHRRILAARSPRGQGAAWPRSGARLATAAAGANGVLPGGARNDPEATRGASPPKARQTDSLASNDFTYYFTFLSKFFSSFPHGICSLSVFRKYLALEGHYLPISAAVPSNTTHR